MASQVKTKFIFMILVTGILKFSDLRPLYGLQNLHCKQRCVACAYLQQIKAKHKFMYISQGCKRRHINISICKFSFRKIFPYRNKQRALLHSPAVSTIPAALTQSLGVRREYIYKNNISLFREFSKNSKGSLPSLKIFSSSLSRNFTFSSAAYYSCARSP